jgi:hypothetical protein
MFMNEWMDIQAGKRGPELQYGASFSAHVEKNLVGYKYYEKYSMKPLFPFGFGLSYQSPQVSAVFGECGVGGCVVHASVSNLTSDENQIASAVLQVYVGYKVSFKLLIKNKD